MASNNYTFKFLLIHIQPELVAQDSHNVMCKLYESDKVPFYTVKHFLQNVQGEQQFTCSMSTIKSLLLPIGILVSVCVVEVSLRNLVYLHESKLINHSLSVSCSVQCKVECFQKQIWNDYKPFHVCLMLNAKVHAINQPLNTQELFIQFNQCSVHISLL